MELCWAPLRESISSKPYAPLLSFANQKNRVHVINVSQQLSNLNARINFYASTFKKTQKKEMKRNDNPIHYPKPSYPNLIIERCQQISIKL